MYSVSALPQLDSSLIVKAIIPNPTVYGMALSGDAKNLQKPFMKYLRNNAAMVSENLEKNIRPIEVFNIYVIREGRAK